MKTSLYEAFLVLIFSFKLSPTFSENEFQENVISANEKQTDDFSNYDLSRLPADLSTKIQKSAELMELKTKIGRDFTFSDGGEAIDSHKQDYGLAYDDRIHFQQHHSSSSENDSTKCHLDLMYTLENVGNLQNPWATHMIDSFGKPESGILQLNLKWYGNYDECINVYAPPQANTSAGNFHGKYCTLQWAAQISNFNLSITSGVCIPDTCSSSLLKEDFERLLKISKSVPVPNKSGQILKITDFTCKPTSKKLNSSAIAVICLIALFSLLAILGSSITAYEYFFTRNELSISSDNEDISHRSNGRINTVESSTTPDDECILYNKPQKFFFHRILGKCKPFLKCFCMFTNGSKLLNTDGTEGQLLCIHGIRFLSMTWVILGHTYASCFTFIKSPLEIMNFIKNWPFQIVLQGFYSVDSFFVLSGFLLAYLFFQEFSKRKGKISWVYFYIHRYIRLTPVYMITLAFSATVSFYLSSGPVSPDKDIEPSCKNNWWWNLLYINNFLKSTDQCMIWTWYLANDMQFFIISPLFLYSLWRWPKIGYSLIALFLCGTCLANFFITYHYELITGIDAVLSMDFAKAQDFMAKFADYFDKLYTKPYTRIGPYLIGIFLGFFLFKSNKNNRGKDNWIILSCGWVVASTLTLTAVYGLYKTNPSVLAASFYNAFNRICFAIGLSWVIYVCLTKQAAIVDGILSYKLFIPLSRLTYCAYLIHPVIQGFYFSSLRSLLTFSHTTMTLYFLGFLVQTYGLALPVSLIFESPIICLEKLIRKKFQNQEAKL